MGTIPLNQVRRIGLQLENLYKQINGITLKAPSISKYDLIATVLNKFNLSMGKPAETFHTD